MINNNVLGTRWKEVRMILRNKINPSGSGKEGLVIQKIIDGIYKSDKLGREVKI